MNALKLRGQNADSSLDSALRAEAPLGQGYTLGAADELVSAIVGGANALQGKNFKDGFDQSQEIQRQELARQREEHPIASVATEVAGGLSSGISLARNGVTAVGRMANNGVRNLVPRMLVGAGEGAAYGGVAGFAGADGDIGDRTDQAVSNLPAAAVLGAGAVPAVDLIGAIVGHGAGILRSFSNPAGRADDLLVQRMAQDRQTPEQLAAAVEAAQTAGQGEYRAVDAAGRNTQRLGAMAAKTPGPARDAIADTLSARQEGQAGRMRSHVTDALGQSDNAFQTEQQIIARRAENAGPLYDRAYANPPPHGQFYTDMLNRQSVREAIPALERTAAERQIPITDMFAEIPNPNPQTRQIPSGVLGPDGNPVMRTEVVDPTIRVPTARGWDFLKKELDARVNQLYTSQDTTAATAVRETRDALREQLANDVPGYREALDNYSDNSAALDAVQAGRDLVTAGNADEARAAYGALTDGQRDLANVGAARELTQKIDRADIGRDRTRIFNTPDMQHRMETLVEDPVMRALFRDRLGRERDMVTAGRTMTGGSNTVENIADGQALNDSGSALVALLSGHPIRAATMFGGRALNGITRAATGMNEDVAQRVGQYLLSADPAQIRSLADLFTQTQQSASAPSIAPAVISAGANAPRSGNGQR
jgi:hypothetical protein